MPELHRRASAWWEAHDEPAEAIAHALAAGDVDHAADLIEGQALALLRHRQEATVRRWLDALPDRVFDVRPVLADAHAGCLLVTGQTQAVDRRLAQAERWVTSLGDAGSIEAAMAAGMQVTDLDGLRRLPGGVSLHRAGLAWMQGDMDGAITHARRALDIARDEPMEAGGAAAILGLALWTTGDLVAAHGAWSEAIGALGTAGHHADVLGCSISLADIEIAQGRLHDARRTYERGLQRSADHGEPVLRGAADMHVGLAELFLEWNDLAAVRHHLDTAAELGEAMGLPQHPYRWRVARAGLLRVQGDTDGALALLDDAERVYDGDLSPDVRPIASTRARLWVATGRHAEALAWARERGLSADDEPGYLREHEHITLARALLAKATDDGTRAGADSGVRVPRPAAGGGRGWRAGSVRGRAPRPACPRVSGGG